MSGNCERTSGSSDTTLLPNSYVHLSSRPTRTRSLKVSPSRSQKLAGFRPFKMSYSELLRMLVGRGACASLRRSRSAT